MFDFSFFFITLQMNSEINLDLFMFMCFEITLFIN